MKLDISFTSIFTKYSIKTANKIKGPKGITCSFLKYRNNDGIKAKRLDRKIENIPTIGCKTSPATNINFISPPPRLSFFKYKIPKQHNNIH